jgi:hypothetical protein
MDNSCKLSYYQLNKNLIKLKLQYRNNNPEYKEKKRKYERQYYQKRKLLKKIERMTILNNNVIPEYLLSSNMPIVKVERGPIFLEL